MRIAVLYWSGRGGGGAETYLESIISELTKAGHQVAFWHEVEGPAANEPLKLPEGVPGWCVEELGTDSALAKLRAWSPDILYTHCLMDLQLESETLKIAPAIFFAHAYYGTCISGNKSFRHPVATPCDRRFGWQCLLNYYPRGCGGSNPLTMLREYQRQSTRLEQLQNYRAIVTHSSHMRDEYIKHGFDPLRVRCLSYYAEPDGNVRSRNLTGKDIADGSLLSERETRSGGAKKSRDRWRLLFLGRMDPLKGGQVLLDALPYVARELSEPVQVSFAGDGPSRKLWEKRAARLQAKTPKLQIDFTGWVNRDERESLWENCDLLVVPSVWPEPFGLVGPEAGSHGVPIAAFDVGGISDWLRDGVNGSLAPGNPPTAEGLAEAIIQSLRDPENYARLQRGAKLMAQQFSVQNHLDSLLQTFAQALVPPSVVLRTSP